MHIYIYTYIHIYIYIYIYTQSFENVNSLNSTGPRDRPPLRQARDHSYEEFTRLAETGLAQYTLDPL